jgi:hypothetical protein
MEMSAISRLFGKRVNHHERSDRGEHNRSSLQILVIIDLTYLVATSTASSMHTRRVRSKGWTRSKEMKFQ